MTCSAVGLVLILVVFSLLKIDHNRYIFLHQRLKSVPLLPIYCFACSAKPEWRRAAHVTPRIPMSVHAKFHADWTKTVGANGIPTGRQTNKQTNLPNLKGINAV